MTAAAPIDKAKDNTVVSAGAGAVGALTTMVDMVATGAPELDDVVEPVLAAAVVSVPVAV